MKAHRFGGSDPLGQAVDTEPVHQEADAAAVHAVDGRRPVSQAVQGFQHEAVAAKRHDDIGFLPRCAAIGGDQGLAGFLRRRRLGGDERQARTGHRRNNRPGQPPVTLMWRGTETAPRRRSITKSWPLGLREIASRTASSTAASSEAALSGARRSAASSWPRHI